MLKLQRPSRQKEGARLLLGTQKANANCLSQDITNSSEARVARKAESVAKELTPTICSAQSPARG